MQTKIPTTTSVSILDTVIYSEFIKRVNDGVPYEDAQQQVIDNLTDAQIKELWEKHKTWFVSNIIAKQASIERDLLAHKKVPNTGEPFGSRRVDISRLTPELSVFDSMHYVPEAKKVMRAGDMLNTHWRAMSRQYHAKSQKAMARSYAAQCIAESIPDGQTTEQALTEKEFIALLPAEGF